ncbi:hypothetical protein PFLUV_G00079740 [Perca fluviatilis]|uniref:Uncharacterized protein n=1 Tax=Perca fluviatilis TaxID=8168 RepID=A0A6A5FD64_PERFL|nr:hypothetical protein PFLUV_G00079740 [Perca fluviatilis]
MRLQPGPAIYRDPLRARTQRPTRDTQCQQHRCDDDVFVSVVLSDEPTSFTITVTSDAAENGETGNNVEVDESLFQDIEDLDLDEDDPDFDPLEMGSDED